MIGDEFVLRGVDIRLAPDMRGSILYGVKMRAIEKTSRGGVTSGGWTTSNYSRSPSVSLESIAISPTALGTARADTFRFFTAMAVDPRVPDALRAAMLGSILAFLEQPIPRRWAEGDWVDALVDMARTAGVPLEELIIDDGDDRVPFVRAAPPPIVPDVEEAMASEVAATPAHVSERASEDDEADRSKAIALLERIAREPPPEDISEDERRLLASPSLTAKRDRITEDALVGMATAVGRKWASEAQLKSASGSVSREIAKSAWDRVASSRLRKIILGERP
jgi:hypothetical protein